MRTVPYRSDRGIVKQNLSERPFRETLAENGRLTEPRFRIDMEEIEIERVRESVQDRPALSWSKASATIFSKEARSMPA